MGQQSSVDWFPQLAQILHSSSSMHKFPCPFSSKYRQTVRVEVGTPSQILKVQPVFQKSGSIQSHSQGSSFSLHLSLSPCPEPLGRRRHDRTQQGLSFQLNSDPVIPTTKHLCSKCPPATVMLNLVASLRQLGGAEWKEEMAATGEGGRESRRIVTATSHHSRFIPKIAAILTGYSDIQVTQRLAMKGRLAVPDNPIPIFPYFTLPVLFSQFHIHAGLDALAPPKLLSVAEGQIPLPSPSPPQQGPGGSSGSRRQEVLAKPGCLEGAH